MKWFRGFRKACAELRFISFLYFKTWMRRLQWISEEEVMKTEMGNFKVRIYFLEPLTLLEIKSDNDPRRTFHFDSRNLIVGFCVRHLSNRIYASLQKRMRVEEKGSLMLTKYLKRFFPEFPQEEKRKARA